ncbi:MAG: ABC transporter substrate-binding protein [Candidatus Bipolaricaulia bacterium]
MGNTQKILLVSLLAVGLVVGWAFGSVAQQSLLRVNFAWPTFIDPAVGNDFSSSSSLVNLYDSLVYPTPEGGVTPSVASRWDVSDDALTWTFHLRRGIRFHDETELTAEDVAFSMNRLLTIGEGYAFLFLGRVEKADALDDFTVQFKLSQPFGPFLTSLVRLYILNQACIRANIKQPGDYGAFGDFGRDYLLTHDCGSGPYKVQEVQLEESVRMEKFDGYWGEFLPGAPDEVLFTGISDPVTVRTLLERGEMEISDQWLPLEQFQALGRTSGIDVGQWVSGSMLYLMMHNQRAPTDNIHFRRALAYALNYDVVTSRIFPGTRKATGPVTSSLPGFNPDVIEYSFDLERARQELALSDYAGETIQYMWTAEVPDLEKIALMFQADAARIGIDIEIVKVPWLNMIENASNPDTTGHIMSIWVAPHFTEAGSLLESKYHSSSTGTWEQTEWLQDPVIDQLIDDSIATVDTEDRFAKYRLIQEVVATLVPSVFVYEQMERHAYQSSYVNWTQLENPNPVMGYNFAARFIEVRQ